jgi:glycosyltransferase involved in cell wall biosynthesis
MGKKVTLLWAKFYLVMFSVVSVQSYAGEEVAYAKEVDRAKSLKRPSAISLTTSIVVPCYFKHAIYLLDLLDFIANQSTVTPDEIIIVLSGTKKVSPEIIEKVQSFSASFKIKLLLFEEDNSEAKNRNIACKAAEGDIIIGQDADDMPHPQRIEIIKYFFEQYDIVHLMHGWAYNASDFRYYPDVGEVPFLNIGSIGVCFERNITIANGPAAFRRFIVDQLQYDESQKVGTDLNFNIAVYSRFPNTLIVPCDIYIYNPHLSSYKGIDRRIIYESIE